MKTGGTGLRSSHMKLTARIAAHALILCLLAVSPLMAQTGYPEFERELQLSEAQRIHIEETKRRYMDELQTLKQESINKRLELRDLDRHPSADPERRGRLQRELGAINSLRQNLYNHYRSDVARVLNQQQRDRYNTFVDTERGRTFSREAPSDRSYIPPMGGSVSPPRHQYQPGYTPTGPPVGRPPGAPPVSQPMGRPTSRGYGR